ncbi:hypothetical protein GCM10017783_01490 [Deinococcus piscis]|uniref:Lipoprotein n=1 Tax=Deinococcus piscis TaxID=394230 RepID=A0ABQ3JZM1_9DEIO|nr:hypothetical protein [Deinococcus piscis]GHF93260.1 hypothetical protein GCM10017783_01490 [Deinococcus piscis]
MNRPLLAAGLTLPLLLAGCQTAPKPPKAPADHDVSGVIAGEWREGARLRVGVMGVSFPEGPISRSTLPQNVVLQPDGRWSYGLDLPTTVSVAGAYQVIVFDDANNDATYNLGEQFARNSKYLIYSLQAATFPGLTEPVRLPEMKVQRGWNLYDSRAGVGPENPSPVTKVTGYDLERTP